MMQVKEIDGSQVIAQRLQEAIEKVGMSQTQIAKATGYTRVYINQMVHGSRGEYTHDKALYKVATALGISPQWLIYGEGEMFTVAIGYNKGQCFDLDKNIAVGVFKSEDITFDETSGQANWGRPVNTAFIPNQLMLDQTTELKAIIVEEQNMQPCLCKDDMAVIDPNHTKIIDGRVFAFIYEGKISFRRVIVNLDGSYSFVAEFPMKSALNVSAEQFKKFCILGVVLCKISFNI